jgi:hypothetical protein
VGSSTFTQHRGSLLRAVLRNGFEHLFGLGFIQVVLCCLVLFWLLSIEANSMYMSVHLRVCGDDRQDTSQARKAMHVGVRGCPNISSKVVACHYPSCKMQLPLLTVAEDLAGHLTEPGRVTMTMGQSWPLQTRAEKLRMPIREIYVPQVQAYVEYNQSTRPSLGKTLQSRSIASLLALASWKLLVHGNKSGCFFARPCHCGSKKKPVRARAKAMIKSVKGTRNCLAECFLEKKK